MSAHAARLQQPGLLGSMERPQLVKNPFRLLRLDPHPRAVQVECPRKPESSLGKSKVQPRKRKSFPTKNPNPSHESQNPCGKAFPRKPESAPTNAEIPTKARILPTKTPSPPTKARILFHQAPKSSPQEGPNPSPLKLGSCRTKT